MLFGSLFKQHLAASVNDLRIVYRFNILAASGKCAVGCGHLKICDTAVGPAEGKRFDPVLICQCRDAEV